MTLNDVVVDPTLPEIADDLTEIEHGPTFADLPLGPELQRAVAVLGYTTPTPIQAEAIAPLVEGRDLQGQAATGLIGKQITYLDLAGAKQTGVVDSAAIEGSTATLKIGNVSVSLDKVLAVANPPAS